MFIFEIVGISLVCFSFMKNISNWKKNLLSTAVFCFSVYQFLNRISKYKDIHSFLAGNPLCTTQPFTQNGFCIYYEAVFIYLIGQILWGYHAMSLFDQVIPDRKSIIYYIIHTIPIFGLIFGYFDNWDLNVQMKTDMFLLTMCILNGDFEIFTWFGFCKSHRFEQFDRGNFNHICKNIENYNKIDISTKKTFRKNYNTRSRKRSLKVSTVNE